MALAVSKARAEEAGAAAPPRGPGRPPGSKTKRPGSTSAPSPGAPSDPPPPPPEPTEAELRGIGAMWGVAWSMLAKTGRHRMITVDEQLQLATATVPVLQKYAPAWDKYAAEIGLALALVGVYTGTMLTPPVKKPAPAPSPAPSPEAAAA